MNEQDIVKVVTGSRGVEYTLPKLYENETRPWKQLLRHKASIRILSLDTPICSECLKERRKQEVIDGRVHNQKLIEITIKKMAKDSPHSILSNYGFSLAFNICLKFAIFFYLL